MITCEIPGCDWKGFSSDKPEHDFIDHDSRMCPDCGGFGTIVKRDGSEEPCHNCRQTGRV